MHAEPQRHPGMRRSHRVLGWVQVTEVTYGAHGWHPHQHLLMVLNGRRSNAELKTFEEDLRRCYEAALRKAGASATRQEGLDVRRCYRPETLPTYLMKGLRVGSRGEGADAGKRAAQRTPFQIAQDFAAKGEAADLELWQTWVESSATRRQWSWRPGLRALAGLQPDVEDLTEEQTEEETEPEAEEVSVCTSRQAAAEPVEQVVVMDRATWRIVVALGAHLLLDAAERGGLVAAQHWLEVRGLPWREEAVPKRPRRQGIRRRPLSSTP